MSHCGKEEVAGILYSVYNILSSVILRIYPALDMRSYLFINSGTVDNRIEIKSPLLQRRNRSQRFEGRTGRKLSLCGTIKQRQRKIRIALTKIIRIGDTIVVKTRVGYQSPYFTGFYICNHHGTVARIQRKLCGTYLYLSYLGDKEGVGKMLIPCGKLAVGLVIRFQYSLLKQRHQ